MTPITPNRAPHRNDSPTLRFFEFPIAAETAPQNNQTTTIVSRDTYRPPLLNARTPPRTAGDNEHDCDDHGQCLKGGQRQIRDEQNQRYKRDSSRNVHTNTTSRTRTAASISSQFSR